MGTFLKLLQLELSSLEQNNFFEPDAELENNDNIVGNLSEELIRLFSLWRLTEKETMEIIIKERYGHFSDEQRKELLYDANKAHQKSEFLRELFWIEIRDEYHLWDKPQIGIRKGRKIVWSGQGGPNILGFGFPGI